NPFVGLRAVDIFETAVSIVTASFKQPALIFKQQATLTLDLCLILFSASPLQPASGDKRFAEAEWRENPLYKAWLQSYLAWRHALCAHVDALDFGRLPRERARYVTSLVTDALAPTNALPGNPAAIKKAIETRGSSIVTGLKNAIEDLVHNNAMPSQVEKSAFRVGENLALSPGAVVFQNEVLELIQYTPATREVYSIPQLIIPPQIN